MKYYKIVNLEGHHDLVYHEGLNIDPKPFNPSGDCDPGGIYFARKDILAFINYGTELYEVEPVGDVYENPSEDGEPKKWKAHSVILKHIGKILDLNSLKMLFEQGANIHACNDSALRIAALHGRLDVVKYLVEQGSDIHAWDDIALRLAASNGHTEIVKYLVEHGADIHAFDESALRLAAENGNTEIVKYLVEHGADIYARGNEALCWAASNGHTEVVKYLVDNGADIHARGDEAFRWAELNGHLDIVKYLESLP